MFEGCRGAGGGGGVPDQFRHYIASRTSISLPISFPYHGVAAVVSSTSPPPPLAPTFAAAAGFESYPPAALFSPLTPPSHHNQHQHQHQHHQSGLHSSTSVSNKTTHEDVKEETSSRLLAANLVLERERSIPVPSDRSIDEASWTNDEVLALLRIRSSMENWFPDFTWEHVSRKFAEVGFQRSAEKCKEKFEEESRNFSSMSYNKSTNYSRFFVSSDLDELYHDENPQVSSPEKAPDNNMAAKKNEKEVVEQGNNIIGGVATAAKLQAGCDQEKRTTLMCRKRKRAEEKFEMFKGFCEAIVSKIIAQQEELHNKLIEDMIRRDEESIAREEAWKNQEIDRINKEIETRAREQAVAGDRQAKIIEFLKKFTSEFSQDQNLFLIKNKFQDLLKLTTNPSNSATAAEILTSSINVTSEQPVIISNPTSSSTENTPSPHHHHYHHDHGCSTPKETSTSKNPNDSTATENSSRIPAVAAAASAPKFSLQMDEKGERDTGKRWPRDEVLALINLRCSLNNNNSSSSNSNEDTKDGSSKGPLWERISQMMSELGYQRSAKRCKEKWENINKYFRKTKDNKKKRSMDSRTCPYFHQLSNLYSQAGTLVGPSVVPENH